MSERKRQTPTLAIRTAHRLPSGEACGLPCESRLAIGQDLVLPPAFTITPEMLRPIAWLDEFKGQWRMMRTLSPEKLTSLRRMATIESVGSSTRIEGSKLTDRQVEDLLGRLHIKGGGRHPLPPR